MTKESLARLVIETVNNSGETPLEGVLSLLNTLQPIDREIFSKWGHSGEHSSVEECWPIENKVLNYGDPVKIKSDGKLGTVHTRNGRWVVVKMNDGRVWTGESNDVELIGYGKEFCSELLYKFFNHKSDANKYLDASQQELLEMEFREFVQEILAG